MTMTLYNNLRTIGSYCSTNKKMKFLWLHLVKHTNVKDVQQLKTSMELTRNTTSK